MTDQPITTTTVFDDDPDLLAMKQRLLALVDESMPIDTKCVNRTEPEMQIA